MNMNEICLARLKDAIGKEDTYKVLEKAVTYWEKGYISKVELEDIYTLCGVDDPELAKAKADRAEAVAALTVEVDGIMLDADETAQTRLCRAYIALDDEEVMPWVSHDDQIVALTKDQIRQALRLAGFAQTQLWMNPYGGLHVDEEGEPEPEGVPLPEEPMPEPVEPEVSEDLPEPVDASEADGENEPAEGTV